MEVFDYDNLILNEKIFGLEIVDGVIKVLELKRSGRKFVVSGFGKAEVDPKAFSQGIITNKEGVAASIRTARDSARPRRIRRRYASVVLPDAEIFVRVEKFPAGMSKEEIREAVEWKAKDLIAMPLEKVYWDWHRLTAAQEGEEAEVVISAVNKDCVDSYTQTFKLLGIIPLYYDLSGNAAARFLFQKEYSKKNALFVRINKDFSVISVFLKGGVRYQTVIADVVKGGYGNLVDFSSSQLSVDPAKAEKLILSPQNLNDQQKSLLKTFFGVKFGHLKSEIEQVIEFYKQTLLAGKNKNSVQPSEPMEIYLYGKGANVFHIQEFLKETGLNIKTKPGVSSSLSPLIQFISRESLLENLVLLGLSIRNLGLFKELRDINLVPKAIKVKYLQKSIYSNLYASLRIIFWNTFIIVVILAFINILAMINKANVEKNLKSVENVAESQINQEMRGEIVYLNKTGGQIDLSFNTQLDWDTFFQEVSGLRGQGISYTNVLVSEDPEVWEAISGEKKVVKKAGFIYLVISGTAHTREDLQRFAQDMGNSDIFSDVKMPISNFETSVDINFVVYCLIETKQLKRYSAQ